MTPDISNFRNSCAEDGVELTPEEASKMFNAYMGLIEQIREAVSECPNFYLELCNRTTEEKLEDIKRLNEKGANIDLKEYNDLQKTVIKICEIEGF